MGTDIWPAPRSLDDLAYLLNLMLLLNPAGGACPRAGPQERLKAPLSPWETEMGSILRSKWLVSLAFAGALLACAPTGLAQSAPHLDKHARKIHRKLTKYKPGSYLEYKFRDHTDSVGNLGAVSATSFTFTNADSNARETHSYNDVARVKKGKTYIGKGTGPHRHFLFF
jgi:hypothetical protein